MGFPFLLLQGLEARRPQRYKWGADWSTNWGCLRHFAALRDALRLFVALSGRCSECHTLSGKSNGGFSEGGGFQIAALSSNPTSQ